MDLKYSTVEGERSGSKQFSVDFRETFRYQDKIKEIKRAFNYCLNNNSSVDQYQSYYKGLNSEFEGSSELGSRYFPLSKESKFEKI